MDLSLTARATRSSNSFGVVADYDLQSVLDLRPQSAYLTRSVPPGNTPSPLRQYPARTRGPSHRSRSGTPSANKTLASDRFGCLTKFDRCICMGLSVAHPLTAVNRTKDPGRSIPPPEERRRSQHPADDRKWDETFTAEHFRPASMASSSASLFRLWMTGLFGAHTLP